MIEKYHQYFFYLLVCLTLSGIAKAQQESFYFIQNSGQWSDNFDYKLDYGSGSVFLEGNAITFDLINQQDLRDRNDAMHNQASEQAAKSIRHHSYKMVLEGADLKPASEGSEKRKQYHNYLLGNDPNYWKSKVPLYGKVSYYEVYPNIDAHYYFTQEGNLKYDFVLNPGADEDDISILYQGADSVYLAYGNVIVENSIETVLESAPYAYQIKEGIKKEVKCSYKLKGKRISYDIGRYDKDLPLIIDPVLVFSTFTGSKANNFGYTATPGGDGSLYAGGIAFLNDGSYPTTVGAFSQSKKGGDIDIVISKFDPTGSNLVYSTYLGGSSSEMPHSMIETSTGELVIMGNTGSSNFPRHPAAFQDTFSGGTQLSLFSGWITYNNGADLFITKLSNDGSTLNAGTLIGGTGNDAMNSKLSFNYGDSYRGEVIADSLGNIIVATCTLSDDFPTSGSVVDSVRNGLQDGVVLSFKPALNQLNWSSYLGGSDDDAMFSLKKSTTGAIVVAGGTQSHDMPMPDTNAYQTSLSGFVDGYVAVMDEFSGEVLNATYNGGTAYDMNFFVDLDYDNDVYLFGQTRGNYPIKVEANLYLDSNSSQFLHKMDITLQNTLKATLFGTGTQNSNISPTAFMVDDCKNIYASGWGGVYNTGQGSTQQMRTTKNALQSGTDGNDFYLLVMDASWQKLNYASHFGAIGGTEHVDGGTSRFKKDGTIYQAVCAGCGGNSNFPTTQNAYSRLNGSTTGCNLGAVKLQMESKEVIAQVETDVDSACIPFVTHLDNLSYNADYFVWEYPSGQRDTLEIDSIPITEQGLYSIKMIAVDTTCGLRDSLTISLFGFTDSIVSGFEADYDSCAYKHEVDFDNLSFNANQYLWDFGDGTTSTEPNPKHEYRQAGSYTVKLLSFNNSCGTIDSTMATYRFTARDEVNDFFFEYEPCGDSTDVLLEARGLGFQVYEWSFSDGSSSEGKSVHHVLPSKGKFDIQLTSKDTLCNREFMSTQTIELISGTAGFQVANVFTPNGDGVNDEFGLIGSYNHEDFEGFGLKVFNRWGSQVFEAQGPQDFWDGTFEGRSLDEGVYYYLLSFTDECGGEGEKKGYIHLSR